MKKSEFKKILKPLIEECLQESLLEKGFLSSIIKECVSGIATAQILKETKDKTRMEETKTSEELMRERNKLLITSKPKNNSKIEEAKRRMREAMGVSFGGVDIFEGTTPISEHSSTLSSPTTNAPSPLGGTDPNDSGVDLSLLMGNKKFNIKE